MFTLLIVYNEMYGKVQKQPIAAFDGGNLICQITLPEAAAEIYMII